MSILNNVGWLVRGLDCVYAAERHQRRERPEDGIGRWRAGDLTDYPKTGFRPDGDVAGGAMSGVIEDATAHLSDADRAAIAAYLSSLSPIPRQ